MNFFSVGFSTFERPYTRIIFIVYTTYICSCLAVAVNSVIEACNQYYIVNVVTLKQ